MFFQYPRHANTKITLDQGLAGAFIAMGAVFATTVIIGSASVLPWGIVKLLGGLAFCLGLILVVVAGAELFTGNNLLVMALVSKKGSSG